MSGGHAVSDHEITLTISGEAESLRPRLSEAVQTLGYSLLSEQPLYAKRSAKGGAPWGCSWEVLDYPTKLTILLKQINQISVVASFSYEVKSYKRMTKGDRQTLLREAEAIAALARERLSISACPSCGTLITDDSHFCRRCGTPLVVEVAELEVLRLTRKTRTAYHALMFGVVVLLVAALTMLPLLWADAKLARALLTIVPFLGTVGLFTMLQGVWQLHFTLNPITNKAIARPAPAFSAPHTQALPGIPPRGSITEATTSLLAADLEEHRAAEPIPRKPFDTGEVDEGRLM